jgi:hypothetical protein
MAALFKRDDKTTIAELEEYYANQKKTRRSKAWMMGILSFMITVGVITSLFFAGRWGYQELRKDDSSSTVATSQDSKTDESNEDTTDSTTEEQVELPTFDSNSPNQQGVGFGDSNTNNPDDLIVIEPSEEEGVVSDEAASITVEPDTADNQDEESTDVAVITGQNQPNDSGTVAGQQTSQSSEIPNTGANENLMILAVIAIVGYAFSRSRQISKN